MSYPNQYYPAGQEDIDDIKEEEDEGDEEINNNYNGGIITNKAIISNDNISKRIMKNFFGDLAELF